jgi:hypothetical protein
MTGTCVTQTNYTSGTAITGLTPGATYYATVTAIPSSSAYVSATGGPDPGTATVQLNAPTGVGLAAGTTSGSLTVTFTASTNAAAGQTYSAKACTGTGMTGTCFNQASITSGGQFTGLTGTTSTNYYVTVTALASTGYLASPASAQAGPQAATVQLNAPTGVGLAAGTTSGSLTVTFTASTNAAAGQTYSAKACTGTGMTGTCVNQASITSGGQFTGLTGTTSTNYYVTVTALASTGYLVSPASAQAGPQAATVQLNAPSAVSLGYGTTAGSLTVNFTASTNAPGGQTYSAEACTGNGMTGTCFNQATITSGGQFTGLAHTQGSAGTSYYVTVTATASAGYLSATSAQAGPQADTSQVNAPTGVAVTPSTTTAGDVVVTFTASSGTAPSSYSGAICTGSGTGCGTAQTVVATGTTFAGLTPGTSYYVQITANPPTGYLSAVVNGGPGKATTQLNLPTAVGLAAGTTSGSLTVSFTAPTNAPGGQTYSAEACTGAGMTGTCVNQASITSGGQFTGLVGTTSTPYYVTVTANASSGYLAATSAQAGPTAATVQLSAPTAVTITGGGAGNKTLTISFTAPSNAAAGQTYSAKACTNTGMSTGCVTFATVTNGQQVTTGLSTSTNYYVTVTALASTGYLQSSASAISNQAES